MQATRTGIELHNRLPFEVRIPPKQIPNRTTMTDDEIDAALQVGLDECAAGKCIPLAKAYAAMERKHGSLAAHLHTPCAVVFA